MELQPQIKVHEEDIYMDLVSGNCLLIAAKFNGARLLNYVLDGKDLCCTVDQLKAVS